MDQHDLTERLRADLKQAMRDRNRPGTRAIRRLMTAISNAEAVPHPIDLPAQVVNPGNPVVPASADVPRHELAPEDVSRILATEISDLEAAIAEYESHDLSERAADLHAEKAVLERYR